MALDSKIFTGPAARYGQGVVTKWSPAGVWSFECLRMASFEGLRMAPFEGLRMAGGAQPLPRMAGGDATLQARARAAGVGGALTLVASTDAEDRAGDVIVASGWDLEAYRQNPVFLWAHDYSRPAIGRSVRAWVQDGMLLAAVEFAPTPFAQEVRSLYAGGFMRGVSVGFRALETEARKGSDGRRGVLFKRQELLEISAAPVPVNAAALSRAGAGGAGDRGAPGPTTEGVAALARISEVWQELAAFTGQKRLGSAESVIAKQHAASSRDAARRTGEPES